MLKKYSKKIMIFFIIQNFYVNLDISLILNYFLVYFFGELPTIAGYRVTQVYSSTYPLKLKLFMVNQQVRLLQKNHKKVGLLSNFSNKLTSLKSLDIRKQLNYYLNGKKTIYL